AIHRGATLLLAPPELVGGPDLAEFLRTEQVTHVATTPGVLATMEPDALREASVLVGRRAPGNKPLARGVGNPPPPGRRPPGGR
ncbi:hypothetical protein, partial [Nocardia wallacei]|uniref:hypothetical protein n=1 Tax=Nocardia wallacei TaxID=480035 RepID=UPI002454F817